MKKFIYVAMVAVAALMVSCKAGEGTSDYYKTHKFTFDLEAGTVNGKAYDNETEKCWKVTNTETTLGIKTTTESYTWNTEYGVVFSNEFALDAAAATGIMKASYKYEEAPDYKDSESCLANNNK
ncbi:MAG: hypothetical protein J5621_07425 [Paludibacteraceae bacterium]|nr:hypothetical protein [Paludibacteraceae bacterium]